MTWDYFYIKDERLVNEDGFDINPNLDMKVDSIEAGEQFLIDNDIRGNVVDFWNNKQL